MRHLVLVLLALLCVPDTDAQRRLTGRASVVAATFGDAPGIDVSPYIAPAAGLAIRFPLARSFDAEIDLGVLPRGAKLSRNGVSSSFRYSYFDLSLLGRAQVETRRRFRMGAFAGPTLSILLQEASEDDLGQVRFEDLSKGTTLAGTAGVVVGYRDVLLDLRFVRGFGSFIKDEARTFEDTSGEIRTRDYVHQALVLSVGLRL